MPLNDPIKRKPSLPAVMSGLEPGPLRRWRTLLTFFGCAAAIAWLVFAGARHGNQIYNPGPVIAAHARFEHDCASCHDGAANGASKAGFFKTVSDTACLKCHDGSIHHINQAQLIAHDPSHPFGVHSTNCVSCHVEHRGREMMLAASDAKCATCHADLKSHSVHPEQVVEQNTVTAFTLAGHPAFGRSLAKAGQLVDPTALNFNHYKHIAKFAWMQTDCQACHASDGSDRLATAPPPPGTAEDQLRPPWLTERDAKATPASALPLHIDRRYMQPINFERNCIGCHQSDIKTPQVQGQMPASASVVLPHRDLGTIRLMIADAVRSQLAGIGDQPQWKSGRRPEKVSREEWIRRSMQELAGRFQNAKAQTGITNDPPAVPAGSDAIAGQNPYSEKNLIDFTTAAVALSSCVECHSVSGTMPAFTDAGYIPASLSTTPTGIPVAAPRVWYVNSRFDHAAHRDMSCVDCHAKLNGIAQFADLPDEQKAPLIDAASKTSEILSPDIQWKLNAFVAKQPPGITAGLHTSCVDCHHPDTTSQRGAPANCITCHDYHDRSMERPMGSPSTPPATQPVASASP